MTMYKQLIEDAQEEFNELEVKLEELNETEAAEFEEEASELAYQMEQLAREIEQLEDESEDYLYSNGNEWKMNGISERDFY